MGKHLGTLDVENVNMFAKLFFRDTDCLYTSTGVLLEYKYAFPEIETMISEARTAATSANVISPAENDQLWRGDWNLRY